MQEGNAAIKIFGFDNCSRTGSHRNREILESLGIEVIHADVRVQSDVDNLPAADWIIDAAANPSVLAGVDGISSSRQVIESNLNSTVNLLEYAKRYKSGFILISTSRVYSIDALQALPLKVEKGSYKIADVDTLPTGISIRGIAESFSCEPPISLYGSTKLCSELLALEYGRTFALPVWINRCGVLAGCGQFGRADQGIFTYWINSYLRNRPLKYVGFGGHGHQVRDCLHPQDLVSLLTAQMNCAASDTKPKICNLGGGAANSMSLKQLSDWCSNRFGEREIKSHAEDRPYDVPWVMMDYSLAEKIWDWQPQRSILSILEEIAVHAEEHPDWLKISGQ